MDFNSFPLECIHLLALGDSKTLYQLQLSHGFLRTVLQVCVCVTCTVSGAEVYAHIRACLPVYACVTESKRERASEVLGGVECWEPCESLHPSLRDSKSMTNHPKGIINKSVLNLEQCVISLIL